MFHGSTDVENCGISTWIIWALETQKSGLPWSPQNRLCPADLILMG